METRIQRAVRHYRVFAGVAVTIAVVGVGCRPGSGSDTATISSLSAGLCVKGQRDPEAVALLLDKAKGLAPDGVVFAVTPEGQKIDVPPNPDVDIKTALPEWVEPEGELPICPVAWAEVADQLVQAMRLSGSTNKDMALAGFEVAHPNIRNAYFILRFDAGVLQWAYIFMGKLVETGAGSTRLREIYGRLPGV